MSKRKVQVYLILCGTFFILACVFLHASPDRLVGASFCHQIASRSPEFNFPYCYRCSGLFSGILCGEIVFFLIKKQKNELISRKKLALAILGLIIYLADILNSSKFPRINFYPESVNIRFLSAFPLGYFLAQVVFQLLNYWINMPSFKLHDGIIINILVMVCGMMTSYIFIMCHIPYLSVMARFLLTIGNLLFLSALYTLLFICIPLLKNEPFPQKNVILSGLTASIIHIVIMGGLHLKFLNFEQYFS